jgi:putative nucleotidyltransferase with HDIG domain
VEEYAGTFIPGDGADPLRRRDDMTRIVVVESEARERARLEAAVAPLRGEWSVAFFPGPEQALAALCAEPTDLLIADFEAPGVGGAPLLRRVQDEHPEVIRFMMARPDDIEVARRTMQVAHQILAKPCEPVDLRESVVRACGLRRFLGDAELKRTVAGIGQLPVMPRTYQAVQRALEDPGASLREVGAIVEQDVTLCAKILQMVNSAFFGLAQRMTSVEDAVCYLGTDVIKGLMLMVEVFRDADVEALPAGCLEGLQRHSMLTARIARRLVAGRELQQDAFMAGLLHDIGKLVLASRRPQEFARTLGESRALGLPFHEVELSHGAVTHAEIGAYLLGLWNLPYAVVEAVAHHHKPGRVPQGRFEVIGATHVAQYLAETVEEGADVAAVRRLLDENYLGTLGVRGRLGEWSDAAGCVTGAAA